MRLPEPAPPAERLGRAGDVLRLPQDGDGLRPQGCNVFEWAGCAAAIAGCAALSGPALVACVALAAPGCVECVS